MRDIKFRLYNTKTKKLYYETYKSVDSYMSMLSICFIGMECTNKLDEMENNILMQSTGLKDCKGNLIREGDVLGLYHKKIDPLDMDNGDGLEEGVTVIMHPSLINGREAYTEKITVEIPNIYFMEDEGMLDGFEIIGNIYEDEYLILNEKNG